MDKIDQAQAIEQLSRDKAIKKARETQTNQGTIDCIACNREIPEARRQANPSATRCIGCQKAFERGKR